MKKLHFLINLVNLIHNAVMIMYKMQVNKVRQLKVDYFILKNWQKH